VLHQIIRSWCTASPLQTVPNVTAHPSTAGVPITVLLYDDPLLCGFKVAIKGLRFGINGDINKDIMQHTGCAFNKRTAVRKVYSRHSGQYTCQFITTNTALRSFFCSAPSTSLVNVIDCRCGGDGGVSQLQVLRYLPQQPVIDTFCFHKIIVER